MNAGNGGEKVEQLRKQLQRLKAELVSNSQTHEEEQERLEKARLLFPVTQCSLWTHALS